MTPLLSNGLVNPQVFFSGDLKLAFDIGNTSIGRPVGCFDDTSQITHDEIYPGRGHQTHNFCESDGLAVSHSMAEDGPDHRSVRALVLLSRRLMHIFRQSMDERKSTGN